MCVCVYIQGENKRTQVSKPPQCKLSNCENNIYFESTSATTRAYKTRNNLKQDPFALSTIACWIEKFETTTTLHEILSSGRHSLESESTLQVMDSLSII